MAASEALAAQMRRLNAFVAREQQIYVSASSLLQASTNAEVALSAALAHYWAAAALGTLDTALLAERVECRLRHAEAEAASADLLLFLQQQHQSTAFRALMTPMLPNAKRKASVEPRDWRGWVRFLLWEIQYVPLPQAPSGPPLSFERVPPRHFRD